MLVTKMHSTLVVCFLLLHLCFVHSNNISIGTESSLIKSLLYATSEIIKMNFRDKLENLNIIFFEATIESGYELLKVIRLKNGADFSIRFESYKNIKTTARRKKKCNLVLLDGIESFELLNKKIIPEVFHFQGFYLFILVNGTFDEVEIIFTTLWEKNIFNVDVIYEDGDSVKVVTFMPFDGAVCGDTSPKLVEVFRNGSFSENADSLFPNKFSNLLNCSIHVATYEDHFTVMRKQSNDGTEELSGIDVDLLNEVSKELNFQTKIKFFNGSAAWGKIFENGTATGALGAVVNRKAQIAIGRYYLDLTRRKFADSSVVYFSFPEAFVISPGMLYSDFEKLFQPFDTTVWICIVAILVIAFLVIFVVNVRFKMLQIIIYGEDVLHPTTNLLLAILGSSQPKLPKRHSSRFLLMVFLVFCLVLRSAYQGSLYKFLQSEKRHKSVETIDEMIEQKFDIFMYPFLDLLKSHPSLASR